VASRVQQKRGILPFETVAGAGGQLDRQRPRATVKALEQLRSLIETAGFRSGSKLPPERQLAVQLGVGRPSLREAIKALTMLDVLESRHGDGTYVKSLAGLSIGWSVRLGTIEENFDLIELLEVRKMFEPRAAALAAARATNKQLQEIEHEFRSQEGYLRDRNLFVQHDYNFHDGIIRAAGNPILIDWAEFVSPLLLKSRRITLETRVDFGKGFQQHHAIFEAIRLGQAELAERAMLDHLQSVALDLISEKRSWTDKSENWKPPYRGMARR
jgi:GntR family transcriptional regulator, transcriptional repressor for pyruvate dehydrogenase complex